MNQTMNELKERMFLQQYLKNAIKQNQSTYAHYLSKKLNGETLSFHEVSKQELEMFINNENLSNKQIASLFNIEKEIVQNKRNSWGIKKEFSLVS